MTGINSIQNGVSQLKYIAKSYCENTSLHGFSYVSNNNLTIFTRNFFMVASFFSVFLCAHLIFLQMQADKYPIMTTIASTSYPVWKVRFPSVTICNFNVVYKDNIQDIADIMSRHGIKNESSLEFLADLSALIVYDNLDAMSNYTKIYEVLHKVGYTTDQLMAELAQPCSAMFKKCMWQSQQWPCTKLFKLVKTTRGYCCAFNYYGTKGELKNVEYSQYKSVKGAGPTFSLRLTLDVDEDKYMSAIKPTYGFTVLVQDGLHYPDLDMDAISLLASEEMTISVTPKIFDASPDIEEYPPEERCCLFKSEGHSAWMSYYSHKTCISECKANMILELCGCIPFYYPITNDTRICTLLDVPCLQDNIYNYNALAIEGCYSNRIHKAETQHRKPQIFNTTRCICYPQCYEIMYDFYKDKTRDIHIEKYDDLSNLSVLNVYYNTNGCIKTDRNVYSTWYRILGVLGGIFGLCSGGSVISILETVYFVLLRAIVGTPCMEKPHFYAKDFSHHQYLRKKKKLLRYAKGIKFRTAKS